MDNSEAENPTPVSRHRNGVATITINRPESLNSLTKPMMARLAQQIKALALDDSVQVIVLTGSGRDFCSGVDLTRAEEVLRGDVEDVEADPVAQMERCAKPIIGVINGSAVAAGFEIPIACDILIAARGAQFIDTHARLGVLPSWGLSQKLPRIIGPGRAREASLTGMPITAEQAEKWGLVNHVVEDSELMNKADQIAEAIIRNNPDLVLRYKSVLNDGLKLDLGHALALEKERAQEFYKGMSEEQFKKTQRTSSSLQKHIQREILLNLPAQYLSSFRLVDAFCDKLITSTDFVLSHMAHASTSSRGNRFLAISLPGLSPYFTGIEPKVERYEDFPDILLFRESSCNDGRLVVSHRKLVHITKSFDDDKFVWILNYCFGQVAFMVEKSNTIIVRNPCTNTSKVIPRIWGKRHRISLYFCLYFDSGTKSFMLVGLTSNTTSTSNGSKKVWARFYSLCTETWEDVKLQKPRGGYCIQSRRGIFASNRVYWMVSYAWIHLKEKVRYYSFLSA